METTKEATKVLKNDGCCVVIRYESKEFSGADLTDQNNDPRFYNVTKRSFRKAAAALLAAWNDEMTMRNAAHILNENGIRTRSYCAMD